MQAIDSTLFSISDLAAVRAAEDYLSEIELLASHPLAASAASLREPSRLAALAAFVQDLAQLCALAHAAPESDARDAPSARAIRLALELNPEWAICAVDLWGASGVSEPGLAALDKWTRSP
jgi:hypothetical protein